MITKESLKGRGFEIRTYRIREPKPVPESQKKARNPQAIAMCTQILSAELGRFGFVSCFVSTPK